ncbi:MAG: hypothetical protein HKO85_10210 [Xanthomonadales bacterium]|nr:hypothetical protein [Gammaproteobacteria bacterium]NNJ79511.1 hypothetical protein [Xanthomonadales bacterium]NNL05650.1 hypothetical protein [Xanthomonadales bacterium]
MRYKFLTILMLLIGSTQAMAQLEPWKDYDVSKELWNITTVKVHPNLGDDYLEGLRGTWVAANKVAMELGHIEDFAIYRSQLPQGGDFNLFLVVKFADSSQLEPNKARYDEFMKAWGSANEDATREVTKNYPSMREITGEYLVRKIDIK